MSNVEVEAIADELAFGVSLYVASDHMAKIEQCNADIRDPCSFSKGEWFESRHDMPVREIEHPCGLGDSCICK